MSINITLQRMWEAVDAFLATEGLCHYVNGCWVPLPLGRQLKARLCTLKATGKWSPSQVEALLRFLVDLHNQERLYFHEQDKLTRTSRQNKAGVESPEDVRSDPERS